MYVSAQNTKELGVQTILCRLHFGEKCTELRVELWYIKLGPPFASLNFSCVQVSRFPWEGTSYAKAQDHRG